MTESHFSHWSSYWELLVVTIVERMLRMGEGRTLKRLGALADQVDALEAEFERLSDAELREETDRFRARVAEGEPELGEEAMRGAAELSQARGFLAGAGMFERERD